MIILHLTVTDHHGTWPVHITLEELWKNKIIGNPEMTRLSDLLEAKLVQARASKTHRESDGLAAEYRKEKGLE